MAVVEPYQTVMYTQSLLEHADVAVMMDIKAPYDVCHRDVDVECPTHVNLSHLLVRIILC